jgi:hypothetical protein
MISNTHAYYATRKFSIKRNLCDRPTELSLKLIVISGSEQGIITHYLTLLLETVGHSL